MQSNNLAVNKLFNILRIIYAAVFVISGFFKLFELNSFAQALGNFKILTPETLPYFLYGIPISEIVLGLALMLNIKPVTVSNLITSMVVGFTALLIIKIVEGEDISCGCFGSMSSGTVDASTFIRNFLLIIGGLLISSYYDLPNQILTKDTPIKELLNQLVPKLKQFGTVTLIFSLCFQSVVFALQNRELKRRLIDFVGDKDVLKEGAEIKSFYALTLNGEYVQPLDLTENENGLIIYLMKAGCKSCTDNIPNWIKLTDEAVNSNVSVFAVSMDSLQHVVEYMFDKKLNYTVYATPALEFRVDYKGYTTPQTILVNNKRRVINLWTGTLDSLSYMQLISAMKKKLLAGN